MSEACRGCGWGYATGDGYCINCDPPSAMFDDDEGDEFDCVVCGGLNCPQAYCLSEDDQI